jgi:hypothetical protein
MFSFGVGSLHQKGGVKVGTFISFDKRVGAIGSISVGGVPKIGFDINGRKLFWKML